MRTSIITNICLALFYLVSGCSTITHVQKKSNPLFPPGIDSLTAIESDSLAKTLFVPESKTIKAHRLFEQANTNYRIADSLWTELNAVATDTVLLKPNAQREMTFNRILQKISLVESDLDKAAKLNPFEKNIKNLYAAAYFLHGNLLNNESFYRKSIQVLEDMLHTEKGEHILFYRLGENFYKLKDWENTFQNYKRAEAVLLATAFLGKSKYAYPDSVDKSIHFRYVYYQAISVAKLYDTQLSLSLFEKAKEIAPTEKEKQLAENYINWIQWDSGNIATAEKKNALMSLVKEREYQQAKVGFEKLVQQLRTKNAQDEISWRIACLEYEFLDQKEQACQRLYDIIKKVPIDETTKQPITAEYRQYISDGGTMFYKLGVDYKKKSKYKDAHRCFSRAAQIEWFGQGRSLLELAKLTVNDSDELLSIIECILNNDTQLSTHEQLEVLMLKLNALKRFGKDRLPEIKETYRRIQSLRHN